MRKGGKTKCKKKFVISDIINEFVMQFDKTHG